jgi:hypothetical protein
MPPGTRPPERKNQEHSDQGLSHTNRVAGQVSGEHLNVPGVHPDQLERRLDVPLCQSTIDPWVAGFQAQDGPGYLRVSGQDNPGLLFFCSELVDRESKIVAETAFRRDRTVCVLLRDTVERA